MIIRFTLLIASFIGISSSAYTQAIKSSDIIALEYNLSTHSLPDNGQLLNDRAQGLEFTYAFATNHRTDTWMRYLNVQHIGLTLLYMDLYELDGLKNMAPKGSSGSFIGILPVLYCKLFGEKRFRAYLVPTFGIGYQTKTWFDTPTDYNRFISSGINFCTKLDYLMEYRISQQLSVDAGLRFLHYSNSAFYLPNTGMNFFTAKTGLIYRLNN